MTPRNLTPAQQKAYDEMKAAAAAGRLQGISADTVNTLMSMDIEAAWELLGKAERDGKCGKGGNDGKR